MNLQEKQAKVEELAESFSAASAAILVDYQGCSCSDIVELRQKLRPVGGRFSVIKNTLAYRAVGEENAAALKTVFTGPTAVVFASDDPVSPAKLLTEFAKDQDSFAIKGGIVDGQVVGAEQIVELASLPSKDELFAKLLSVINAPATQLVRVLNAPASDLARLLEAWRVKQEENEE